MFFLSSKCQCDIMRINCLFLTLIVLLFETFKTIDGLELGQGEAKINTELVEYQEDDAEESTSTKKKERFASFENFVGTNLFGDFGCHKKCFSSEDVAMLAARRDFESLLPKDFPNCLLNDDLLKTLMQYFCEVSKEIGNIESGHSRKIAQKVFLDTLGGFLKFYVIPMSKYSFYAGVIKLKTVENVLELYSGCKTILNTQGNRWRSPIEDFSSLKFQIEPLKIVLDEEEVEEDESCAQLELFDEDSDNMIVSLPRLEPEEKGLLGSIWLPFKRKRTFNLQSSLSAFILLRYFEVTTKCFKFQGICQETFNRNLKDWLLENIEVHLKDDIFYPGLGAVLRIKEVLGSKNKEIVVVSKADHKRQKTQNYKILENKANTIQKTSKDWIEEIFTVKSNNNYNPNEKYSEKDNKRRRMYIYIAITVALLLFAIVVAIALIHKWGRKNVLSPDKPHKKAKRVSINETLLKRPSKEDEEVLLGPESPSIASSSKLTNISKSTSSIKRNSGSSASRRKCFPLCTKRASLEKSISSLDSDSEEAVKKNQPASSSFSSKTHQENSQQPKLEIMNEKKRITIPKRIKKKREDEQKTAP